MTAFPEDQNSIPNTTRWLTTVYDSSFIWGLTLSSGLCRYCRHTQPKKSYTKFKPKQVDLIEGVPSIS